ncbi:hypothetical protein Dsin_017460 [Dipteronia sinensis]|uniref:Uncharacterized protein n=1 Tax=Dipteronia sinensis TaxID=43782 RepID=A0AAE0AF21_9ROSI|nr:hypothetical protein Dsin_017460 [Dipteronia sinensis]
MGAKKNTDPLFLFSDVPIIGILPGIPRRSKEAVHDRVGDYLFAEKFLRRRRLARTPLPIAFLHRQHLRDPLLQALVQHHLLDLRHLHRHSNNDCVGGADGVGEGV